MPRAILFEQIERVLSGIGWRLSFFVFDVNIGLMIRTLHEPVQDYIAAEHGALTMTDES